MERSSSLCLLESTEELGVHASSNTIPSCVDLSYAFPQDGVELQESYSSSEAEKYALQRLVEWLDELHAEQEESSDLLANQSLLAYLQSYRDTFSRASLWQVGTLMTTRRPGLGLWCSLGAIISCW